MADPDPTDPELKMYCVWRTDLAIPYPKAIVQGGHVFLSTLLQNPDRIVQEYLSRSQPKVVLRAKTLAVLERAQRECAAAGIVHYLVVDEGRTVFPEPTTTCLGIGPVLRSELPKFVDRLQLLK
jgi:peptidyl-tRNA hydrolase